MSYNIIAVPRFKRNLKHLTKKYPSLKREYDDFLHSLEHNPMQGTSLGRGCYKIRLSIASKGKGKSGGARVITHVCVVKTMVYLLSIYDKSDQESIYQQELDKLLKEIDY